MKISHISQLSNAQITSEIDRIISELQQTDQHVEAWINQAVIAIAAYDAPRFHKLFADAVQRLGLIATYEKILYPLLVRTGLMWTKGRTLAHPGAFFIQSDSPKAVHGDRLAAGT